MKKLTIFAMAAVVSVAALGSHASFAANKNKSSKVTASKFFKPSTKTRKFSRTKSDYLANQRGKKTLENFTGGQ